MSKGKKVFVALLIIAAIVVAAVVAMRTGNLGGLALPGVSGNTSGYQAVFLTNNQVYFGKITGMNSQFPTLRDIYYLQVNRTDGAQIRAEDVNLVKLGNELHGPTDEMRINRDHILLVEDLKSDSGVVDAIKRFVTGADEAVQ